ncbi:MAG TPA: RNA 2',3'-cyclic phosphodiesterase [Pseudomonadales bacterium]|nr:RNA 2',3'-cyclic phosphodiesterase [Pseudomonadales bacterium]
MNSTETLRLFLAIQIPDTIKAELQRWQDELKPWLPKGEVRWAKPEQFHLTLKFLGNVPVGDVKALSEATRVVCQKAPPMPLKAGGVGFFPNELAPRVYWVGINSPSEQLQTFQQQLDTAVSRFVEKEEAKNFTAHVTLARFEKLRRGAVEEFMKRAKADKLFGEWTVREVELVQSKLMPSGAFHAILDTFRTKNE